MVSLRSLCESRQIVAHRVADLSTRPRKEGAIRSDATGGLEGRSERERGHDLFGTRRRHRVISLNVSGPTRIGGASFLE